MTQVSDMPAQRVPAVKEHMSAKQYPSIKQCAKKLKNGVQIFGVRVRVHPAAVLMALLALRTGLAGETACLIFMLFLHEAAHFLAAKALGVEILEVRLMPFGAMIKTESPYALTTGQAVGTALAGPAINALAAMAAGALAWSGKMDGLAAYRLMRAGWMLCMFNLAPVLPLDGGRALCALLSKRMENRRAVAVLTAGGWALAGVLFLAALAGLFKTGKVNLTLILCGVFLVASGFQERQAEREERTRLAVGRFQPREKPYGKVRIVPISEETPVFRAAQKIRPRTETLFAVYREGRLWRFLDARDLSDACVQTASSALVGEVCAQIHAPAPSGGRNLLDPARRA